MKLDYHYSIQKLEEFIKRRLVEEAVQEAETQAAIIKIKLVESAMHIAKSAVVEAIRAPDSDKIEVSVRFPNQFVNEELKK